MRITLAVLTAFLATQIAYADIITRNSSSPGQNDATLAAWLGDVGIAEGDVEFFVDFELGFTEGQNVSGVPSLFPGGLIIVDTTGDDEAIISGNSSNIGGSNPVGEFAVTHNESPWLELDFSARSVDYVAFQDIDHTAVSGIVTFEGGGTNGFSIETTGTGGNSAEFFGIFRNDQPRITRVQMDASGDGEWAIDNIRYGRLGAPDTDGDGVDDDTDNCPETINADQRDTNGDGIGNACDADITDDCSVNFADLAALKAAFFPRPYVANADFDGDSLVNFGDLAFMKSTFFNGDNPGPGPGAPGNDCE